MTEGMKYCTNNGDLVFLLVVLSLVGICALAIIIVNFKRKRCAHELLIKRGKVEAYLHAESKEVCLTYYHCAHCEELIKKTTPIEADGVVENSKEGD